MRAVLRRSAWVCLAVAPLLRTAVVAAAEAYSAPNGNREYAQIGAMIGTLFAKSPHSALTVGIVEGGRLVWVKNYGVADPASGRSPTSRTIYSVASVTKVLTGIMFLQLVERGVVHFTDPVERYVPEIHRIPNPYSWTPPLTLMQLATMTSGLAEDHWPSAQEFPSRDSDPATWDQRLMRVLPHSKYDFEPGTRREYSNVGYRHSP